MSPSNRDLSDWLIVQAEGKSFVGKPLKGWSPDTDLTGNLLDEIRRTVRLSPIYEYAIVLMNTPQGPQPIPRLQPVWGLLSVSGMTIPARVFIRFADLTAEELKAFTMLVEQTEEGIKQARAQAAGVSLVMPGGPLPPYPGRTRQ